MSYTLFLAATACASVFRAASRLARSSSFARCAARRRDLHLEQFPGLVEGQDVLVGEEK
jgi:hypothetical protein